MKNKETTRQKIIESVGEIFRTEGKKGLYIANIARTANVDHSLIYQYFGKDINRLVEEYIIQKDYWLRFFDQINEEVTKNTHETIKDLIIDILQKQWQYVSSDRELQELILLELSGESDLMRSIHNTRELESEQLLELTDEKFKNSMVKFRPIAVPLLSGIYYANIHSIHNGNMICGMDVKSKAGQLDLLSAIRQIVEWAYLHSA